MQHLLCRREMHAGRVRSMTVARGTRALHGALDLQVVGVVSLGPPGKESSTITGCLLDMTPNMV